MPASFDPYHRWLGIPPKQQPPTLYRFLGLELFESDVEVIRDAAEQRMGHVRTYQLGKHSELSQKIPNELAAAKVRLLDPAEKAAYDALLRASLVGQAPATGHPPTGEGAQSPSVAASRPPARDLSDLLDDVEREAAPLPPLGTAPRRRRSRWLSTGQQAPTPPAATDVSPTTPASGAFADHPVGTSRCACRRSRGGSCPVALVFWGHQGHSEGNGYGVSAIRQTQRANRPREAVAGSASRPSPRATIAFPK
jgi:hypothetical protein